jgi:hypothetical protein
MTLFTLSSGFPHAIVSASPLSALITGSWLGLNPGPPPKEGHGRLRRSGKLGGGAPPEMVTQTESAIACSGGQGPIEAHFCPLAQLYGPVRNLALCPSPLNGPIHQQRLVAVQNEGKWIE